MTKSQLVECLQKEHGFTHILANSVVSKRNSELEKCNDVNSIIAWFQKNKPKPFVKWVGGKRQLLKQFMLMDLYPPKGFYPSKNNYFESFIGDVFLNY